MSGALEQAIFEIVEIAVLILELLAVAIVVSAVLLGMVRYLRHVVAARALEKERFDAYRTTLARALLLGMELWVGGCGGSPDGAATRSWQGRGVRPHPGMEVWVGGCCGGPQHDTHKDF